MPMRRRRTRSSRDSQGGAIDDGTDPSTDGASGDNDTTSSSGNAREWPESLDHHHGTAAPPQPRPAAEPPRGSPETTLLAATTSSSSASSSVTASGEAADTALTAARREALLVADPDTTTTAACVGGASSAGNTQPRDIPCTDRPPRRSASPGSERGIAVVRPPQYSNLVVREEPRRPVSSPRPPPPPPPPLPRLPRGVRRTPSLAPGGTRRGSLASAPHGIGSTIPHRNNTSRLLGRLAGTGTGADAVGNIAGIPSGGGVAPRPSFFDMIPDNIDEPAGGSPPSAAATTTGARAGAATAAARGRNRPATRFRRVAAAPSGREPPGNITGVRRRGSTEGTGLVSNVGHGDGAPGEAGAPAGATAGGGVSSAAGAAGASGAADSSSTSNVGGGRGAGGSAAAAAGSGGAAGGVGGAGEESRTPAAAAASTTIHQLHKASVVGDLTAISRFIEDGGNLEAQSFCGRTALHYAAFYGHADVARALILGGANVCSRGGGNSTPLHFAAWGGNKRVVRLLLEYGADVEARDTEGNTPQAYSEDDELYEMLVRARRRLFPLPSSLSGAMEKRPLRAIAAYSALLVACMYISAALVVTWASSASTAEEESSMTDGGGGGGLAPSGITTPFWLSVGIGGKAAAAAAAAGAQAASGGGGAGEGVPSLVFWTALPVALLAGLAPAVAFAIGFKRKTDAYWHSVKDRDMEIVRLRHREQASGGWPPATHPGAAMDAARASAAAAAGTAGGTPSSGPGAVRFMTPSPRGISRGEQAGQAVIARLSRLQAAPGAAAGVVAPGGGMRGGAGVGGHIHRNPELQMQIRRYHQAMMAVGGVAAAGGGVVAGAGGAAGGGGNGGGRGRPGVQVAQ